VNAVGLVEGIHAADPREEEGDEREVELTGHVRVHRSEAGGVVGAEVGRRLHPQEENGRGRILGARRLDDRPEVAPQRVGIESPEAVVGAGLEHEHRHRLLQEPLHPLDGPR